MKIIFLFAYFIYSFSYQYINIEKLLVKQLNNLYILYREKSIFQFSARTLVLNRFFSILAIGHLVYLGMIFDDSAAETGYSYHHTIRKWSESRFASHIVAVLTFILSYIIWVKKSGRFNIVDVDPDYDVERQEFGVWFLYH